MISFLVGVTTYNRPKSCLTLLRQIQRQRAEGPHDVRVVVVDDGSTADYAVTKALCREHRATMHFHQKEHGGKRNYWSAVNIVMLAAWAQQPTFAVLLQDDVEVCQDFFQRLDAAHDMASGAPLNLHVDSARMGASVWGAHPSSEVLHPEATFGGLRRVNWLDCLWSVPLTVLTQLDHRVLPIVSEDPALSSGVGRQLTERLNKLGTAVYQPLRSLVKHLEGPSVMHPKLRAQKPLHTVNFIDGKQK